MASAINIINGMETILVVDDEPFVLEVSRKMLEALGYHVITAGTGKDALNIYSSQRYSISLVILDIIMPDMGGQEAFEHLKIIDEEVKVIVSSGYSRKGQADRLLAEGCKGFLQKPFRINTLSQTVRQILET